MASLCERNPVSGQPAAPAAGSTTPAIPSRLTAQPVAAGVAVPWIVLRHTNGTPVLGLVDGRRQRLCLAFRRCQACGKPLTSPLVLIARPRDMAIGYVTDPGLHPECAAYSAAACPMLAGTMQHYRSVPRPGRQWRCGDPRCDCRAWAPGPGGAHRSGHTAEPFAAIWISLADYRLVSDPKSAAPIGIDLRVTPVRRVRPLAAWTPSETRSQASQERSPAHAQRRPSVAATIPSPALACPADQGDR